jgi:trimeric autotransporter adhesin
MKKMYNFKKMLFILVLLFFANFGYSQCINWTRPSIGTSGAGNLNGGVYVFFGVTPSRTSSVTALSFNLTTTGATQTIRLAIYSGANSPTNLLGYTNLVNLNTFSPGIRSINLVTPVNVTAGTTYFVGACLDSSANVLSTGTLSGNNSGYPLTLSNAGIPTSTISPTSFAAVNILDLGLVYASTALPTASSPQNLAFGAKVSDLSATGTLLQWYSALTGGSALTSTTALTNGTTYYVSQTLNDCESPRRAVVANVAAPNAICSLGSTLTNYTFDGTWSNNTLVFQKYTATGSGTMNYLSFSKNSTKAIIDGSIRMVVYSDNNGNPENLLADTGTIMLQATPATTGKIFNYPLISPLNVVQGVTYHIGFVKDNCSVQGFIAESNPLGVHKYINSQAINTLPSTIPLASINTITNVAFYSDIYLSKVIVPTAAASQSLCFASTVSALSPSGTGIKWYDVATGGTPLATTTTLATGNYYVSQTNGGCESDRVTVSVTVNSGVLPTATSPQNFCNSATVANLIATGNLLKWYNVASGGVALTNTTALISGTYYVSQTTSGCETARRSVTVNVTKIPSLYEPIILSQSSGLSADIVASGNITFSNPITNSVTASVDGGGSYFIDATVSVDSGPLTAAFLPTGGSFISQNTPNLPFQFASYSGNNSMRISSVGSGILNLNGTSKANAVYILATSGNSQSVADFTIKFADNTNQTFSNITINDWYNGSNFAISGIGRYAGQIENPANNPRIYEIKLDIAAANQSKIISSVQIDRSGAFASGFLHIMGATFSLDQKYCSNSTLADVKINGANIKWYTALTGGTLLPNTTSLVDGTTYYASQTVNSCETDRKGVTISLNVVTPPTASSPQSFSTPSTINNLVATGTSLQWYATTTGGTVLPSTTALVNGSTYYVSQTTNGCESARTSVLVDVALGTNDFNFNSKLSIYPNPSNAIFNITIDSNATIEVYDLVGKQILAKKIELGTSQIDMSNYNTGMYLLKVTNADNQTKTMKIVKQ